MAHAAGKKVEYTSESSIFGHANQMPKPSQLKLPTWSLIAVLIVSFFILKSFIYISDKKRHGK